jgi:hypothetical protein
VAPDREGEEPVETPGMLDALDADGERPILRRSQNPQEKPEES